MFEVNSSSKNCDIRLGADCKISWTLFQPNYINTKEWTFNVNSSLKNYDTRLGADCKIR